MISFLALLIKSAAFPCQLLLRSLIEVTGLLRNVLI